MSAKALTITSGKDDVEKTTTTTNLAVAKGYGDHKVVSIDGKIGLRNLDVLLCLEKRIVYDLIDIVEGRYRTKRAMISDNFLPKLYFFAAGTNQDLEFRFSWGNDSIVQ